MRFFTGGMPFLSANQKQAYPSTEEEEEEEEEEFIFCTKTKHKDE